MKYSSDSVAILNKKETLVPTRDNKQLNVLVQGDKDRAIIFLHGLGENHNFFTHQLNEFGGRCKILSVDQRGHGLSYRLKSPERISLQTWVDDVYDIVKFAKVKQVVLMGHSFGATVSLKFAMDHPGITAGIVTTGGLSELEPEAWKALEVWINAYDRKDESQVLKALSEYNPEWDLYPTFANSPENKVLTERMKQVYREDDPYNFIECGRAINDFALTPELGRIACPTLLLAGDSDMWVPVSHSAKLSMGIPNSMLKIFYHASHLPHIEQPEIANQLISNLLAVLGW
jgi:pimeloyl-ACP methyl ester carboxylesterase